jgi:hypothetical protein
MDGPRREQEYGVPQMAKKTSVYLTDEDQARITALGFPPLGEVLRAGLAVLEQASPPTERTAANAGTAGAPNVRTAAR